MDELVIINFSKRMQISPTFFQSSSECQTTIEPRRVVVKFENVDTVINPTNHALDMIRYIPGKVLKISVFKSSGDILLRGIFPVDIKFDIYDSTTSITKHERFESNSFEINYREGGLEVIDLIKEEDPLDDLIIQAEKMALVPSTKPRIDDIQTSEEIDIINIIGHSGPVTPTDIGKALKLEKNVVNRTLLKLFKAAKVDVYRNENRGNPRYVLGTGIEYIDEGTSDVNDIKIRELLKQGPMTAPDLAYAIFGSKDKNSISRINSILYTKMIDVVKGKSEYEIFPVWKLR